MTFPKVLDLNEFIDPADMVGSYSPYHTLHSSVGPAWCWSLMHVYIVHTHTHTHIPPTHLTPMHPPTHTHPTHTSMPLTHTHTRPCHSPTHTHIHTLTHTTLSSSGVVGNGLCVFSRFPIVAVYTHQFSVSGGVYEVSDGEMLAGKGIMCCRIQTPEGQITFFNTHVS